MIGKGGRGHGSGGELAGDEGGVAASEGHQGGVGALLDDAAGVHEENQVGVADGRETVGGDDHCSSLTEAREVGDDAELGLGVERGGGLVEEDYRGVAVDGTGYHQALAFAAAQFHPRRPYEGVEFQREFVEEWTETGCAGSLGNFLHIGGLIPQCDVAGNRVGENVALLRDAGADFSPFLGLECGHIDHPGGDGALLRMVKPLEELHQGRFAASARTDDGGGFPRGLSGQDRRLPAGCRCRDICM